MKKFYPIVRRKSQWELLLITLLMSIAPIISKATSYNTNLVTNGSAESGNLSGWTLSSGSGFSSAATDPNPKPKDGTYVFDYYINANDSATLTQTIDISDLSTDISNGKVKAVLSGWIYKMVSSSTGRIIMEELNSSDGVLSTSPQDCPIAGTWGEPIAITKDYLNTSTRKIRITLYGYVVSGSGDFVDFDMIDLKLYKYPTITTTAATSITTSSAILGGNVTADGDPSAERGVVYSTSSNTNPTIGGAGVTKVAIGSGSGSFSQNISGLSGAQLYYFNSYATNTAGTVYGTVSSFTTLTPTYLTATTNDATNVTINSATLNGTVNANGHTTNCYFQYGITVSYGAQVAASPSTATGTSATTETVSVSSLSSSTTYHFRMAAYNATEGWKYGDDKTFTTATPVSEIGLKQGTTAIADGSSYDFGYHQPNTNTDIIFTIENTGTGALTLTTPITIGGTNSDQFSIQAQPSSSVSVSGSTTFTIRFTPTSIGNKTATISITNNDSDENPYDLTITGQGYLPATVTTNAANYYNRYPDGIVATGMTVNGTVNANNNSTTVVFEYGLTTSYGSSATATQSPVSGTTATSVSCDLTGLTSNTEYHYRVVGTNLGGAIYGSDQTFITPIVENFVDDTPETKTFTEAGTSFTTTGYLKVVNFHTGFTGRSVDDYFVCNNLNPLPSAGVIGSFKNESNNYYANSLWVEPGIQAPLGEVTTGQYGDVIIRGKKSGTTKFTHTLLSSETVTVNYTFIDLSSYNSILIDELEFEVTGTINYMRIDAFCFNYPAPWKSTITTQAVSTIGATSATDNGNLTDLGNPNPTAYGICYGTTENPTVTGSNVDKGAASETGAFTAQLTGLTAGTTYHARAFATNTAGTVYGDDVTFTTIPAGTWTGTTSTDWNTATNWAGGSVPTSATDVTIPSGKTAVISAATSADCNNLSVIGTLTIESTSAGTGSLIIHGTPSGDASYQRYMTANAWHILSSPVSGQTVGGFLTASTTIKANPNPGYETYRALKDYNEASNSWNDLTYTTASTDLMSTGKGYAVWPASDGVATFSGTLLSGDQNATVVRIGYGWNCVGNPYSSALKINTAADATNNFILLNSDNVEASYGAIYVWDQSSGNYSPILLGGGDAAYVTSGQGFFVRIKSGITQLSFTSALQSHNPGLALRSALAKDPCIMVEASQGGKKSLAKVYMQEGSTRGLDFGYDAGVFKSGFDVYTQLVEDNGVAFAVQSLPPVTDDGYVIPVGLETTESGTVSFSVQAINIPEGYRTIFDDMQEKQSTELTEECKTLLYDITSGTTSGRFCVRVNKVPTGLEETLKELVITTEEGEIVIRGRIKPGSTALLYDLQGRCLSSTYLNGETLNRIDTHRLSKGIYLLELRQDGSKCIKKMAIR